MAPGLCRLSPRLHPHPTNLGRAGLRLQEALATLQRYCNPSRPADICAAARAYCLVAARSQHHHKAAHHAALCLRMNPAALAAAGTLQPCLEWLNTVQVRRLELSSPTVPLTLSQLQALSERLPSGAGAGVRRLVVAAERFGQTFEAGEASVGGGAVVKV